MATLDAVVGNYSAAGIPLEAIWSDIDYMLLWRDFTLDPQRVPLPRMQAPLALTSTPARF